jgi:hypothetical protein
MAKRLAVPKHLEHLIEKRDRDRRGKPADNGHGKSAGNERRKSGRRKSD